MPWFLNKFATKLFTEKCLSCLTKLWALADVAQWIECGLRTKGSPVRFPVRAYAWVAGQVPGTGHARGNHMLMFPSLSPSLPFCLK